MAFLSAESYLGQIATTPTLAAMGYMPTELLAGGDFVFATEQANGTTWEARDYDAAFRADFTSANSATVTPEPATTLLLATGLVALLGGARRRSGRSAEDDRQV